MFDKDEIRRWAAECGFEQCGFASACSLVGTGEGRLLRRWIEAGRHASMAYMADNLDKRLDPRLLLPEAETAVVVLMNYFPGKPQPGGQPRIASYAYGQDYHFIVRSRLRRLAERMSQVGSHTYAVFCDSAPVMERSWALRAGLGWIGRSGMLVNPRLGTYSFVGVMFTSAVVPPDTPMPNRCGRCGRCIAACPTAAIDAATSTIDAGRCISYLTIESRHPVPEKFLGPSSGILYGCDRCMEACPWNRFAHPTAVPELQPLGGIFSIDWTKIGRGEFNRLLKLSPMKRAGYRKLRERALQMASMRQCE